MGDKSDRLEALELKVADQERRIVALEARSPGAYEPGSEPRLTDDEETKP